MAIDEAKAAALGEEVLDACRTELMMAFRFLDAALWHAPFVSNPSLYRLDTDGSSFQFGPVPLLERYVGDSSEVVRDYLHTLLHCVFRHPYDDAHPSIEAWDIACDIVVESIALEMAGMRWPTPLDEERTRELAAIAKIFGSLNPYRIYRGIVAVLQMGESAEWQSVNYARILEWRNLFFRDTHFLWKRPRDGERGDDRGESGSPRQSADAPSRGEDAAPPSDASEDVGEGVSEEAEAEGAEDAERPDPSEDAPTEADAGLDEMCTPREVRNAKDEQDLSDDADDESAYADHLAELANADPDADSDAEEEAWRDIAKRMEVDLASFAKAMGSGAGSLVMNLQLANRPPVDYAEFLRQFATVSEELKVNDDEFDYVFYTYGLSLYGNMPLVEPLEYQETKRVREFAIAIDTSGSCEGELVRTFVTRTCEILRESEQFGSKVNIHVIQCDARIQRDTKITSLEDLEEYRDTFCAYGGGGTDFRPVFAYVDELVDQGEFEDLRGLIYFTDGEGTYPSQMPAYDTAFVFVDDDPVSRRVPPWAMKIVIDQDGIRAMEEERR